MAPLLQGRLRGLYLENVLFKVQSLLLADSRSLFLNGDSGIQRWCSTGPAEAAPSPGESTRTKPWTAAFSPRDELAQPPVQTTRMTS